MKITRKNNRKLISIAISQRWLPLINYPPPHIVRVSSSTRVSPAKLKTLSNTPHNSAKKWSTRGEVSRASEGMLIRTLNWMIKLWKIKRLPCNSYWSHSRALIKCNYKPKTFRITSSERSILQIISLKDLIVVSILTWTCFLSPTRRRRYLLIIWTTYLPVNLQYMTWEALTPPWEVDKRLNLPWAREWALSKGSTIWGAKSTGNHSMT